MNINSVNESEKVFIESFSAKSPQRPQTTESFARTDQANLSNLAQLFQSGTTQSVEVKGALEEFHTTIGHAVQNGSFDSSKLADDASSIIKELASSLGIDLESSLEEFDELFDQLNNSNMRKTKPQKPQEPTPPAGGNIENRQPPSEPTI